jgi:glucokinase
MDIVIGIDIGGTTVRVGAITSEGELLAWRKAPIEAARGPQAGLEKISGLIQEVLQDDDVAITTKPVSLLGVGIGCTGPVDPVRGVINNPYTLPTWENVPIWAWLEDRFSVPVTLENDADTAALGEYWIGAGRGVKKLYAITVGTGIGTALIVDGRIYRGLDGAHPEGGHQVIDPSGPSCYCGQNGCWEILASGTAITQMGREMVSSLSEPIKESSLEGIQDVSKEFADSPLLKMNQDQIDTRKIAELAHQGDDLASKIMQKAVDYFCLGLANIIVLFTPDMIVFSGGVMENVDLYMPAVEETIRKLDGIVPAERIQIRQAQLGSYAGLYGAAYTILKKVSS